MLVYHRRISDDFCYIPFTAKDRTPFFYILTHVKTGKRYAGVKISKGCHPSQLWTTYFPSNPAVSQIIARDGKDAFTFEIRAVFDSVESCQKYESRFLEKIHANENPLWYNSQSPEPKFSLSQISDKVKTISIFRWVNNGKKEHRVNELDVQKFLDKGYSIGRIITNKVKKLSNDHRKKISQGMTGRIISEETKKKIAEQIKSQPKNNHCEHCSGWFTTNHFNQWHGSKCRQKKS